MKHQSLHKPFCGLVHKVLANNIIILQHIL